MEATENQILDSEYDDKLDETTAMSLGDEHEVDDNDADMQQNSNVTDSVFNLIGRRRVRRRGMPFRRFIRRRRRGQWSENIIRVHACTHETYTCTTCLRVIISMHDQ